MESCKANKCKKKILNSNPITNGMILKDVQNLFKDGFCKRCFNKDKRFKNINWIPDQLWKRDGIYGEPYDFPRHKTEDEKKWVQMIYELRPHLKPKEITAEEKIKKIKEWLDENESNISYKHGKELMI